MQPSSRSRTSFVPDADVIATPGNAFKSAMTGITAARTHVAAMANGIVEECLSRAVDYVGRRTAFGVTLLGHQGIRWSLADVATRTECFEAADLSLGPADRTRRRRDLLGLAGEEFCLTNGAAWCWPPASRPCGAIGLKEGHAFGRHLAAARIAGYVDGTTEIQRDRIGQLLPKHYGAHRDGAGGVIDKQVPDVMAALEGLASGHTIMVSGFGGGRDAHAALLPRSSNWLPRISRSFRTMPASDRGYQRLAVGRPRPEDDPQLSSLFKDLRETLP